MSPRPRSIKEQLKAEIIGGLQAAIRDIEREDRVDALDMIGLVERKIRSTMPAALQPSACLKPSPAVLSKLGSIIVHAEEGMGNDGHHFDIIALRQLLADSDVSAWLKDMRRLALLPETRRKKA